jgi:hypothetical protein
VDKRIKIQRHIVEIVIAALLKTELGQCNPTVDRAIGHLYEKMKIITTAILGHV